MPKDPTFDRRKYPRVRTETPMSISHATKVLGRSVNLSPGGIRFQWPGGDIELGVVLHVTLKLGVGWVSAVGEVVRIDDLDDHQEVALAFTWVDEWAIGILQDVLGERLEA